MKKSKKRILLLALSLAMLLSGCQTAAPSEPVQPSTPAPQVEQPDPVVIDNFNVVSWFEENEAAWRTVENGKWSTNPADAPTDEELAQILDVAVKAQTAIGFTQFYFIAVRDYEEQKAIIGEETWAGSTSPGTVTVLILADQIADPEYHKDEYKDLYMQSSVAYFDTGMACGLLNVAAYSLGYGTHYFTSPAGTTITPVDNHTFGIGTYPTPNWDISRFVEGRNYKRGWGLMQQEYDVEGNAVMIGAVVIGKPDPSIDAMSTVTMHARPKNWVIWEADENTEPLK